MSAAGEGWTESNPNFRQFVIFSTAPFQRLDTDKCAHYNYFKTEQSGIEENLFLTKDHGIYNERSPVSGD